MAITLAEPYKFFQHGLGILAPKDQPVQELIHVLKIWLPFITLFSTSTQQLSYAISGWNVLYSACSSQLLTWGGARNVLEFACTYFQFKAALILHHAANVGENSYTLIGDIRQSKWKKAMNNSLQIIGDLLYLATFIRPRSTKIPATALRFQAYSYFIRAAVEGYILYMDPNGVQRLQHQINQDKSRRANLLNDIRQLENIKQPTPENYELLWRTQAQSARLGQRIAQNQAPLPPEVELAYREQDIICKLLMGCIRLVQATRSTDPFEQFPDDKPCVVMRAPGGQQFVVMRANQERPLLVSLATEMIKEQPSLIPLAGEKIQALKSQGDIASIQWVHPGSPDALETATKTANWVPGNKDLAVDPRLQGNNQNDQLLTNLKKIDKKAYKRYWKLSDQKHFDAKPIEGFESEREIFTRVDTAIRETLNQTDKKTLTVFILGAESLFCWLKGLTYTS